MSKIMVVLGIVLVMVASLNAATVMHHTGLEFDSAVYSSCSEDDFGFSYGDWTVYLGVNAHFRKSFTYLGIWALGSSSGKTTFVLDGERDGIPVLSDSTVFDMTSKNGEEYAWENGVVQWYDENMEVVFEDSMDHVHTYSYPPMLSDSVDRARYESSPHKGKRVRGCRVVFDIDGGSLFILSKNYYHQDGVQYRYYFQDEDIPKPTRVAQGVDIPSDFELQQNYPNPFNPSTTISFNLPDADHVSLVITNAVGQHVATLVDGHRETGSHSVVWNRFADDGQFVPSGIYFYTVKFGNYVQTKRMTLLK